MGWDSVCGGDSWGSKHNVLDGVKKSPSSEGAKKILTLYRNATAAQMLRSLSPITSCLTMTTKIIIIISTVAKLESEL